MEGPKQRRDVICRVHFEGITVCAMWVINYRGRGEAGGQSGGCECKPGREGGSFGVG